MGTKRIVDLPTTTTVAADDYLMIDGSTNATRKYSLKSITDAIESIEDGSGLEAGSVGTTALADGAVTTIKIGSEAVTTAKIDDGAVTTAKIADDAVTAAKMADDAVGTDILVDGAVTSDKLASGAVGTAKIADGAVTLAKIASGSGATSSSDGLMSSTDKAKLDGFSSASNYALKSEIAGAYIYRGSVLSEDLLPDTEMAVGDVYNIVMASSYGAAGTNVAWNGTIWDALGETFEIGDGSVGTSKLANDAVITVKINDGAVTESKLASNAVTSSKIADNAVGSSEIADGAVGTSELSNGAVTTIKIADDAVTNAKMADDAVDTDNIVDEAVTKIKLADDVIDELVEVQERVDILEVQNAQLFGNQLTGTMSGTIATVADAYAAPPMALTVDGASTQAGTPTPDAPVEILSVDDLSLVMVGKNLFDYPTEPFTNKATSNYNGYAFAGGFRSIPNGVTTITASMFIDNSAANDVSGLNVWTHNSNGVVVPIGTSVIAAGSMGRVSRTYDVSNYNDFALGALIRPGATVSQLMAELGSTATAYEPYAGTTIPDLLPEGTSLRSLPDGTRDQLNLSYLRPSTRAGWAWYNREVVKRCEGKTFDGTDMTRWIAEGTPNPYWSYRWTTTGATNSNYTGLSNNNSRCTAAKVATIGSGSANIAYFNTNLQMRFRYRVTTDETVTVADLAAYFAEHPTTFVVPMQEPITTTLDPIELPTLPAPNATVWCDGGSAQPSFVMEYVRDTNIVIANMQAMLDDLATS